MNSQEKHEYINDFLYFVVCPDKNRDENSFLVCSGVNTDRFLPITKGRHRPMSNPAIRGLQLVNYEVRALALSRGASPKAMHENECLGIVKKKGTWSKERLRIENVPESLPEEIISFAVPELLRKIDKAAMLGADMPDTLLDPDELQIFIESLCRKYGK